MIKMLSGNEAVARGMWEAGVAVASAYPGTPSTEILENYALFPNVYAEWAPNEKVAVDVAIGAAYAGRRGMAVMKHVGLNVAADSFMYASMTGQEGGLVIVTADDPAMHSSQNEQDNRTFARFGRVPCLEPSDSQEAKDMVRTAFELSERFDTPVLLRLTTRICHSATAVELGERNAPATETKPFPRNPAKYVMVPGNAIKRHPVIEQRIRDIALFAESFPYNRLEPGGRSLGILTCGVAYQYAREVFPHASILRLGMTWPLPEKMIRKFARSVERLIVIEELDPFIEDAVRLMGIAVQGKSIFPITGEFDPRVVRESAINAGLLPQSAHVPLPDVETGPLPGRPPVLCSGCPHRPTFYILNKLKVPVNGDIGCYTLALTAPLSAIHTCGCMGAGIGVAHGAAKAGSPEHHVAVIGDSTFFHTGIPALVNVVYNNSPVTTVILDNRITGMTGHQENPGTGRTLLGQETTRVELEPLVRALGVRHVQSVPGYDVKAIEKALKEYVKLDEPSVLIAVEPCALLPEVRKRWIPLEVLADKCNGCTLCFRIGCPAILKSEELDEKTRRPKALIDAGLCTGCEVCADFVRGSRSHSDRLKSNWKEMPHEKDINFLLCGVGGQGTILASDVLVNVGLAAGFQAKQAEVHGMSQRGGSVTSNVRWGKVVYSPLIGAGEADVLLAFEKLEALRSLKAMRPGSLALVNMQAIEPLTAISGDQAYPSDEALRKAFAQVTSHVEYINGEEIAGTLGNLKVANVVLLGALSALLESGVQVGAELTPEVWLKVITERVPPKHIELNRKAFQAGREAVGKK